MKAPETFFNAFYFCLCPLRDSVKYYENKWRCFTSFPSFQYVTRLVERLIGTGADVVFVVSLTSGVLC